ncbi:hypothetical protein BGZ93_002324 [Podila epicladia]|nr:hypothetical protein BGZ92_003643 [Podila epicladia]KAG0082657.1 hypothetical protein BGZ93_002324 [Podila epicladia]
MESGAIAVIGTTGVGKSNLSTQLAKELDGEMINGDALQIKDIHGRKHMPIVVGGTHYYIQSLLWRDTTLDTEKNAGTLSDTQVQEGTRANEAFLRDSDTATLYKKLQKVDPLMANKWHENDRRKITRSLQLMLSFFCRQNSGMPTCIFRVYSASGILNARLDARVDVMIKGGLFEEIQGIRKIVGTDTDYKRGIWQAIDTTELEALKAEYTETMKSKTRQYAKRQVLWIRNKLLPLCKEKDNKILLDATSLDTWKEKLGNVAVKIAKDFFAGNLLPNPESLNQYAKDMLLAQRDLDAVSALESWEKKECKICTDDKYGKGASEGPPAPVIIHGPTSWKKHLRSRQHRKFKTNQTEMERDGSNWWFFRAQEYK